jgi:abhydrolase domain-containing protein 13
MITCSDGVQIHAWLLHAPVTDWTKVPTILFFHGNAGNIGLRIPNAIQMLQQLGSNVLMVEYRGYGNSDNVKPTERGLKLDAQAALLFAHQHTGIDSSQIFIFGRSLGGSVAIHLAHVAIERNLPFAGVMVENTFTSISDMVNVLMPFLIPIKKYVLRIGWDSASLMPNIGRQDIPLLLLAGAKDELVPHQQMKQLFTIAQQHKAFSTNAMDPSKNLIRIHIIPNGTHNESWLQGGLEYWEAIRNFMLAALRQQSQSQIGRVQSSSSTTTSTSDMNVDTMDQTSIPTMPNQFVNIAKSAIVGNSGVKKEL